MTTLQALILAVVEGITEYLPISSTGHLIIASALMGLNENPFVKSFNIIIQFGAILSVVVLYWPRLRAPMSFYVKIAVGFLPAAILGLLVKNKIDAILGRVEVVGAALFIGGIVLILVDRWSARDGRNSATANPIVAQAKINLEAATKDSKGLASGAATSIESLTYQQAFLIGLCQCFAFIPGVSRSAASILGGLGVGLSRKEAAEFSFFLAVPTLTGATALKMMKILPTITSDQISLLALGTFVSFVIGCLSIKTFIDFLSRRGFFIFGFYRILIGALVFMLLYLGWGLVDV